MGKCVFSDLKIWLMCWFKTPLGAGKCWFQIENNKVKKKKSCTFSEGLNIFSNEDFSLSWVPWCSIHWDAFLPVRGPNFNSIWAFGMDEAMRMHRPRTWTMMKRNVTEILKVCENSVRLAMAFSNIFAIWGLWWMELEYCWDHTKNVNEAFSVDTVEGIFEVHKKRLDGSIFFILQFSLILCSARIWEKLKVNSLLRKLFWKRGYAQIIAATGDRDISR